MTIKLKFFHQTSGAFEQLTNEIQRENPEWADSIDKAMTEINNVIDQLSVEIDTFENAKVNVKLNPDEYVIYNGPMKQSEEKYNLKMILKRNLDIITLKYAVTRDIDAFRKSYDQLINQLAYECVPSNKDLVHGVIIPALKKLLGVLIGILLSPALPFSYSAQHYVNSFFYSQPENKLHQMLDSKIDDVLAIEAPSAKG